jgi:hypothetical protein
MTTVTASREGTPVSPELALVDPRLAEQARKRLPAPPDTLDALGVASTAPPAALPAPSHRPRRWRSRVMTWAGMLVILAGTAFLIGSRADVQSPTASPPAAIAEPQAPAARTDASEPVTGSSASTATPRRPTGAATATRRFAWAPVVGATGYHVELFKGSSLIFRDDTKKPEILIRRRWRFNGRERRLEPGAYRWYVWALAGDQRNANAIVQARLVVAP